jgi:hypothetical protein
MCNVSVLSNYNNYAMKVVIKLMDASAKRYGASTIIKVAGIM